MTCPRFSPRLRRLLLAVVGGITLVTSLSAAEKKPFDIPAGTADKSLKQFTAQSGAEVVYPAEIVRGVTTPAVKGELTPAEALQRLLAASPLVATQSPKGNTFMISRDPNGSRAALTTASDRPQNENSLANPNGRPATGSIEGRVMNPASDSYLARARLTVEGTSLETFTDADGYYRLSNVRAGEAKLKAFYTGMAPRTDTVQVPAGQTARHDVSMVRLGRKAAVEGEVVKLDQFVVSTSKEMEGSAIAINEQRFAPNQKMVVATDEFGFVPEGNIGEFMKFLPGVQVLTSGAVARDISIDGVSAAYVPITVGGFSLASATLGGGTSRNVAVDLVSINSLARIEVAFSPTPDTPGSALSGSVELVPRSAFERSRPRLDYSVYLAMRDNARDFHRSPGPTKEPERKVTPGFDFVYVRPVNQRFGFTLSGGSSKSYKDQEQLLKTWRGAGSPTNGTTFPHTTGDQPYLTGIYSRTNPAMIKRDAADVTFDYKLTPEDRISFSLLSTMNHFASMAHTLTFNVLQVLPGDFTPRSTHGAAGRGSVTIDNIGAFRDNATYMATLVWRHVGAVWRADAGIAHSQAEGYEAGGPHGAFRTAAAQRSNVTVSFDNLGARTPAAITVRDGPTGAPVDPYSIDTYAMSSAGDTMVRNSDLKRTAYLNVARSFNGRVPFSLKAGLDLRQAMRDERRRSLALTFVGADGRTSTTPVGGDDQAAPFLDAHTSLRSAPFGFQRWQRLSADKLWTYYQANPSHFAEDANASYRSLIASSKRAEEIVSAGYLRGDIVFNDRLKLTGGVRAEQANIRAEGPLTDPARNYQLDAKGDAILGSNGQPLPITNNPLQISRLTYLDRSSHAEKEYLRLFPSLNASFSVRENLVARAAYYYSLGRPDFNQYAGGLTLPDVESAPSPNNRIVVNNAGIKPWTARSTSARLDYYFAGVGQVSIGGFRRDFKNFWGNSVTAVTPEFLALYGLDPAEYSRYDVSTQQNIQSTLRMTGWTISYKQALTFLPRWARGMQVFANGTQLRLAGEESARGNLNTFFPRSASWGVSLDRAKFNLRTNFNYRSPRRTTLITGASIDPNTYYWDGSKLSIDVLGEYRLGKQFSVFANLRNANVALDTDYQYYGPRTPAFAKSQGIGEAGALWTFGVKGGF